jgi:predicted nucleic acid-binding Zn ribbon protein
MAIFGYRLGKVPTYVYETTDQTKPVRRFEIKQSFNEAPLQVDPKTGEALRRVISGGYSVIVRGGSIGPSVGSCGSHSE